MAITDRSTVEPVVAIVQARMGSRRFPGKMLAHLGNRPLLEWVLHRLKQAKAVDLIVLATSDKDQDAALAQLADTFGVHVYRGSEEDVLGRFSCAADQVDAKTVVRVCADNPLIAPEAVDLLIETYIDQMPDYAFNHVPRMGNAYPDGLGAEIMSADLLYKLDTSCSDPGHREHATKAIWDNRENYAILAVDCPAAWRDEGASVRLDVDRPEDLEHLQALYGNCGLDITVAQILANWAPQQST